MLVKSINEWLDSVGVYNGGISAHTFAETELGSEEHGYYPPNDGTNKPKIYYMGNVEDDFNEGKETTSVKNLKVFHGTNNKFEDFDLNKTTDGIWFTDSEQSIKDHVTGGTGNKYIMTRYITLNNPAGWEEYEKYNIAELINMKYDGVILPDENKIDYLIFDPKSISTS